MDQIESLLNFLYNGTITCDREYVLLNTLSILTTIFGFSENLFNVQCQTTLKVEEGANEQLKEIDEKFEEEFDVTQNWVRGNTDINIAGPDPKTINSASNLSESSKKDDKLIFENSIDKIDDEKTETYRTNVFALSRFENENNKFTKFCYNKNDTQKLPIE